MKTLLCLFAVAALVLAAPADVNLSGKWSGSFNMSGPGGETRESGIVVQLKQNGTELTGTAGPEEGEQYPIANGKVEGEKVTFDVRRSEDHVIKVALTVDGERLKGGASMDVNGAAVTAKIDMGRAK